MLRWLFLFAPLLTLVLPYSATAQSKLRLVSLEYPPYVYNTDRTVTGVAHDMVMEALDALNVPATVDILPWTRSLHMVRTGEADGIFTIFRTPEREAFLDYGRSVLVHQTTSMFVRDLSGIQYSGDLEDLQFQAIGVRLGVSYGSYFDTALRRNVFANVHRANSDRSGVQMLINGRIDVLVINRLGGRYFFNRFNAATLVRELFPPLQRVPSYIAFTRQRDFSALISALDKEIVRLRQDGSYQKILAAYELSGPS